MKVTPPDLEMWLVGYVRSCAAEDGHNVEVSNKEPKDLALPLEKPLIVIRDDSGPRVDWTTFDRSIGGTVLAGSKQNDQPANDIARWLAAVLFDHELPLVDGTPIVSVDLSGSNGPYPVTDSLDVARRYLTAQYVVAGSS